jgi:hypothetical protein
MFVVDLLAITSITVDKSDSVTKKANKQTKYLAKIEFSPRGLDPEIFGVDAAHTAAHFRSGVVWVRNPMELQPRNGRDMHTFSEKQMKRCHDAHNDKIISIQLHTV